MPSTSRSFAWRNTSNADHEVVFLFYSSNRQILSLKNDPYTKTYPNIKRLRPNRNIFGDVYHDETEFVSNRNISVHKWVFFVKLLCSETMLK